MKTSICRLLSQNCACLPANRIERKFYSQYSLDSLMITIKDMNVFDLIEKSNIHYNRVREKVIIKGQIIHLE